MSISFSGLASGLDTDSWVSALVSVKQLGVTSLQNQLSTDFFRFQGRDRSGCAQMVVSARWFDWEQLQTVQEWFE